MQWFYHIVIFFVSAYVLHLAGGLIVNGLTRTARFLGWKEFVVEFFAISFASSLPNLFVGISSALDQIPELSFGDIMGNDLIALTVGMGLALLFATKREIPARGKTLQTTAIFTTVSAILPIVLLSDATLSRTDGFLLICLFLFYVFWLFSKKERFQKIYESEDSNPLLEWKVVVRDAFKMIFGVALLIAASQAIIYSAVFFASELKMPIALVGLLIVGTGSALPEVYFSIFSARQGKVNMIAGNLMGAVIIPASLVLGIVSVIHPIHVANIKFFTLSRFFIIVSSIIFYLFIRSENKLVKKEGALLILLYVIFIITTLYLY